MSALRLKLAKLAPEHHFGAGLIAAEPARGGAPEFVDGRGCAHAFTPPRLASLADLPLQGRVKRASCRFSQKSISRQYSPPTWRSTQYTTSRSSMNTSLICVVPV